MHYRARKTKTVGSKKEFCRLGSMKVSLIVRKGMKSDTTQTVRL